MQVVDLDGYRNRWSKKNLNPSDKIIEHVKPEELDKNHLRCYQLFYADSFLGRSLVGRISKEAKANQAIKAINLKGEKVDEGRLTKILDTKEQKSSD